MNSDRFLIIFIVLVFVPFSLACNVSIDRESDIFKIRVDSIKVVKFFISVKESSECYLQKCELNFEVKSTQPDSINVVQFEGNSSIAFPPFLTEFNASISLKGLFPGFFELSTFCELESQLSMNLSTRSIFQGSVVRQVGMIDKVMQYVIRVMVFVMYANMGTQLDIAVVKETLKRPIGPAIGFFSQFIFMPLVSYVIGYLLLYEHDIWRLGIFLFGCSPGGNSSNFWTLIFKGDLNLSITMTFISCIASLGMMPLWLYTLGKTITKTVKLEVPFTNLVISLVTLTSPIFVGILVKYFKPKCAEYVRKVIRPLTFVIVIAMIILLFVTQYFMFRMFTGIIVLTGFLIAISGYILGAVAALVFRLNRKQIIAISIETAFQNGSIALVILHTSFDYPESDLAVVPIIAQALITGQPLWLVYAIISLSSFLRKKRTETE
ncbi:sodium/bile acid cotransporter-like protein [Leptotrombidium deliense]|uniref:Sodium/bile acid cotransporter-like protein n=1 Tax=Leptotrombidium deliense TaxID=299467 RepID=A0A443SCA9_9ACAR|nr:sodium/bile acid cotransporter-like protein [Leptotrombidium deliense]